MNYCGGCEHLDYATAYLTDPPEYKCELYGCIVRIDDLCKRDLFMKKMDDGKPKGDTADSPGCPDGQDGLQPPAE